MKKTEPAISKKLTSDIKSNSDKISVSNGGVVVVKTNSERIFLDNDNYLGSTRRQLKSNSKNDLGSSQNLTDQSGIP